MTDPVAVLLKFAFIAVLYLFLLWIARSAMKDLRRPAPQQISESDRSVGERRGQVPCLISQGGGGLDLGLSFTLDGLMTIGRSPRAEIEIEDTFASGNHARIYENGGYFYIEDMNSTNGTYVNGQRVAARELLRPDDRIRIGGTEFRYSQP
jgi:hypothetical protein